MLRAVLTVVVGILFLSCSDTTGPLATVSATVTNVATSAAGSLDAKLDVAITNSSSQDIYLATCATSLERQNAEADWEQVWSVVCALITSTDRVIIPAGASRAIPVRITAQGNGTIWPAGGLDGAYRLRLHFFPSDAAIQRMASMTKRITAIAVVSNEFALSTP